MPHRFVVEPGVQVHTREVSEKHGDFCQECSDLVKAYVSWPCASVELLQSDPVNHPAHYSNCGSCAHCGEKIEVIQVTEQLGFVLGNAVKYILRAEHKGATIEDLEKARWYVEREIANRRAEAGAA